MIRKHGLSVKQALAERAERKEKRRQKAKLIFSGKPRRITRSKADKMAWESFSSYIRLRDLKRFGMCYWCGVQPIQAATHLIPRGRAATKYDEGNVFGGCHSCNYLDGPAKQHDRFVAIFIRKNGHEPYLALVEKSKQTLQRSKADLLELAETYRIKRQELSTTTNVEKESA